MHRLNRIVQNVALILILVLGFNSTVSAQFPFTIKTGHPRLYIDSARINTIKSALQIPIPLSYGQFPSEQGTLEFDIKPVAAANSESRAEFVFDQTDAARNHIFFRYRDDPNTTSKIEYDLWFSRVMAGPAVLHQFSLDVDQWQHISISWNSITHYVSIKVDGIDLNAQWVDENGAPRDWQADGQEFVFSGRDGLDNIRLYSTQDAQTGSLLAEFMIEAGTGADVINTQSITTPGLVNKQVTREVRQDINGVYLQFKGDGAKLTVPSGNDIRDAWLDIVRITKTYANRLLDTNSGNDPVYAATSHPNSLVNVARALGMGYQVTTNAADKILFEQAILNYADKLIAVDPVAGGNYTMAGRIEAMGILYDWSFNLVSAQPYFNSGFNYHDKLADSIKSTLLAWQSNSSQYLSWSVCGRGLRLTPEWTCTHVNTGQLFEPRPDYISGHSHQNNTEITAGVMAIRDEHPDMDALLNLEYFNFTQGYNPAREWISVDGGHHMGWKYGATYTFLDSILLWNRGTTNISMSAAWQDKLIDRYIYGLRGDLTFPVSGDNFELQPGYQRIFYFSLWSAILSNNPSGIAAAFYHNWVKPNVAKHMMGDGNIMASRLKQLMYWEPLPAESPIENLV